MEYIYGVQASKFMKFDGTNLQDLMDTVLSMYTTAVAEEPNRYYSTSTSTAEGPFDVTLQEGDMLAWGGISPMHLEDWSEQFVRVLGPGEGNA